MFCPSCGIEERQANQFCRACGTDLQPVRYALEIPDQITASAETAREQIGRAFAAKIRDAQTAAELKIVAEDVLPEIEKFLESPEEKRLSRIREGVTTAAAGAGATVLLALIAFQKGEGAFLPALGLVAFLVGIGMIVNGLLFTVPKKALPDKSGRADGQRALDAKTAALDVKTNELVLPEVNQTFASVTDETTRQLREKTPIPRA